MKAKHFYLAGLICLGLIVASARVSFAQSAKEMADAVFMTNGRAFEVCMTEKHPFKRVLINACKKTAKRGDITAEVFTRATGLAGFLLYENGDYQAANTYLGAAARGSCETERSCSFACRAAGQIGDGDAILDVCRTYLDAYSRLSDYALLQVASVVIENDYIDYAINYFSQLDHMPAGAVIYHALLKKSGREDAAKAYLANHPEIRNFDLHAAPGLARLLQFDSEAPEAVAAIAYCPANGAVGVANSLSGPQAGVGAYQDCLTKSLDQDVDCCRIVATTDRQSCVSIAVAKDGSVASAEGSTPELAAASAISACGASSCRALSTKCVGDL